MISYSVNVGIRSTFSIIMGDSKLAVLRIDRIPAQRRCAVIQSIYMHLHVSSHQCFVLFCFVSWKVICTLTGFAFWQSMYVYVLHHMIVWSWRAWVFLAKNMYYHSKTSLTIKYVQCMQHGLCVQCFRIFKWQEPIIAPGDKSHFIFFCSDFWL